MMPILACSTSFLLSLGVLGLLGESLESAASPAQGSATQTVVVARGSRPVPTTCGTPAHPPARLAAAGTTYTVSLTHRQP